MLTLRLVLFPFVGCQFACGRGMGLLAQPFPLPGQNILRSVLGAEVSSQSSGAAGGPSPEEDGTEHCGFLYNQSNGFCWVPVGESVGLFCIVSAPLFNSSHTVGGGGLCWTILKEFITCRANRAFSIPVEQRMYQELGIQVLCLFRRKGWDQCPGAARHQPTLDPRGCLSSWDKAVAQAPNNNPNVQDFSTWRLFFGLFTPEIPGWPLLGCSVVGTGCVQVLAGLQGQGDTGGTVNDSLTCVSGALSGGTSEGLSFWLVT